MTLLQELLALTEGKSPKKVAAVKQANEYTAGAAVMAFMGQKKKQAGAIAPKTAFSRNKDKQAVRRDAKDME
jgi:hypothetical protein